MTSRPRIVSWFSCGTSSAVTAKLILAQYGATHDIVIARCIVPEEHEDNDRFARDCETWFGQPILNLKSDKYESCEDVWTKTRYMSGVGGARCTVEMKKVVRFAFEADWHPDLQAFGYHAGEVYRAVRFRDDNPDVTLITPLIDAALSKEECHAIVDRAGIVLPFMYRAGFNNANCRGCVNAQSPSYWNRTRRVFPADFDARAKLSRELCVRLVKLTTGKRERVYLDELEPDAGLKDIDPPMECGLLCHMAEEAINEVSR